MKENEWIISPSKLKENQKKVIEMELLEEEKRKHKFLCRMFLIIVIEILFLMVFGLNKMTNIAINECVKFGNSESFCINELAK